MFHFNTDKNSLDLDAQDFTQDSLLTRVIIARPKFCLKTELLGRFNYLPLYRKYYSINFSRCQDN